MLNSRCTFVSRLFFSVSLFCIYDKDVILNCVCASQVQNINVYHYGDTFVVVIWINIFILYIVIRMWKRKEATKLNDKQYPQMTYNERKREIWEFVIRGKSTVANTTQQQVIVIQPKIECIFMEMSHYFNQKQVSKYKQWLIFGKWYENRCNRYFIQRVQLGMEGDSTENKPIKMIKIRIILFNSRLIIRKIGWWIESFTKCNKISSK